MMDDPILMTTTGFSMVCSGRKVNAFAAGRKNVGDGEPAECVAMLCQEKGYGNKKQQERSCSCCFALLVVQSPAGFVLEFIYFLRRFCLGQVFVQLFTRFLRQGI